METHDNLSYMEVALLRVSSALCFFLPLLLTRDIEVRKRIKVFLDQHPEVERNRSSFITGMGWDQTTWEGGKFPTAVGRVERITHCAL
jgi:hypothetical protein